MLTCLLSQANLTISFDLSQDVFALWVSNNASCNLSALRYMDQGIILQHNSIMTYLQTQDSQKDDPWDLCSFLALTKEIPNNRSLKPAGISQALNIICYCQGLDDATLI